MQTKRYTDLFLQQSYLDSWEDYETSLHHTNFIKWDYIVLTASNDAQAETYREQIQYRLDNALLPVSTQYAVLPDPDGKRVGSGGATFNVLKYISEHSDSTSDNIFKNKRILVIHSGGDSKRVPQYSAVGKLFSPVPRELPNGRASTLFDEFIIGMSGVPSRISEGMLVLSGDVLLLFNPLQIDLQFRGAAAISIKEPVEIGKNHGVFLNDGNENVERFLHKQTEEKLRELGAVNDKGCVDLDTGAVVLDANLLNALFSLISTNGKIDDAKFNEFVNGQARISFYGDFLYPLAMKSTLDNYYKEAAEGTMNEQLLSCRTKIWNAINENAMKLICLSPAEFIHFGTTRELLQLVTADVKDYEFLNWKKNVLTNREQNESVATHNAYIGKRALVGENSYIEDSYILNESHIGNGCVISNVKLTGETVEDNTVLHGLKLSDAKYVVRTYGVSDNPKGTLEQNAGFLNSTLRNFLELNGLQKEDLWEDEEHYLWFANLYPACDTMGEAIAFSNILTKMAKGQASPEEVSRFKQMHRTSLYSSFNKADVTFLSAWQRELENRILSSKFIIQLEQGMYYKDALNVFGDRGITEDVFKELMKDAESAEFGLKIRIYYAVSKFMRQRKMCLNGKSYDAIEGMCFKHIQSYIFDNSVKKLKLGKNTIHKDRVDVELPVRVNWGGGWTDTPPYCNENGGVVINAAIKLKGISPVQVTVKKLQELYIEFESTDVGVFGTASSVQEIQDCHNPYDYFALHKAALIACGIVPLEGDDDLKEILAQMGGGIYISTQVVGVPKGSGLGTSSILSGACVKALFEFMGRELSDAEIYDIVLCMEQIMSTGGGWQDQVGGLTNGIKFITTKPGIDQKIKVENVSISENGKQELQDRFALIYTGQRRLARNLLRDVVGGYLGARPESINALTRMRPLAALMRFELEQGNIDNFGALLNQHWELSKQLDKGSTNSCIDQMILVCEDLIDGKFISGAGGGGFIQVILKKGISKEQLRERLRAIFQESGVDVWDSEFIY